uniref:Protein RFT1 homolog n=2 Tax=Macrostomum lignano TaxID=282301 RepID=A0A1I8HT00_9PLAT
SIFQSLNCLNSFARQGRRLLLATGSNRSQLLQQHQRRLLSSDPSWLNTLLTVCLSPEHWHIRCLSGCFSFGSDSLGLSWCSSIALGTVAIRTAAAVAPPALARALTRQPWFRYELKQKARECDQRLMLLAAYEARRRSWSLAERDSHLRQLRSESVELRQLAAEFAALQVVIGLSSAALQAGVFVCSSAAIRALCGAIPSPINPAWLCLPDPYCALPLATVALNIFNYLLPNRGLPKQSIPLPAGLPSIPPAVLTGLVAGANALLLYIGAYYAPASVALYWLCSAMHQAALLGGLAAFQRFKSTTN